MTTPIQPKQNDPADVMHTERSVHIPPLPLELWNLIFKENTDPQHLWNVGRQVCASWRAEIPKVVAKKYLEDRRMTEITSSCPLKTNSSVSCLMGRTLAFDHYEGKNRMVFAGTGKRDEIDHDHECNAHFALMKEAQSQNINDFHNRHPTTCLECTDKMGGERCDLPLYCIRIKKNHLTTELSGLEVDFAKGEISVEWEAMLTAFYREAAVLERHGDQIARKAVQWFGEKKRSLASVVRRALEDRTAFWDYSKEVRNDRIKSWHCCDHGTEGHELMDHDDEWNYDYGAEWAEKELRMFWERNSSYDGFNAEDSDEKQTWDYRERLDDIGRILINSGRHERWHDETSNLTRLAFYEKDEHGESSLRKLLFAPVSWLNMTAEDLEDLESRCVIQWLGMGRV